MALGPPHSSRKTSGLKRRFNIVVPITIFLFSSMGNPKRLKLGKLKRRVTTSKASSVSPPSLLMKNAKLAMDDNPGNHEGKKRRGRLTFSLEIFMKATFLKKTYSGHPCGVENPRIFGSKSKSKPKLSGSTVAYPHQVKTFPPKKI